LVPIAAAVPHFKAAQDRGYGLALETAAILNDDGYTILGIDELGIRAAGDLQI